MNFKILLFYILIQATSYSFGQETIGLLYHEDSVVEGYTLFTPENNTSVYLIDNCGNLVNEWTFSENPALTCYLLENGNLLRAGRNSLEIRGWDNTLVWSYNITNAGFNQHHDIEPLPNGNILCLVKNIVSPEEQIALGKNPDLVTGNLGSEKIIEFHPIGNNDISVVWEWDFLDRIIQDFDMSKPTYGIVADHPELIDFNYEDYNMTHIDWIHMNSIDYNADLDQILMSSKSLGEIYIIDHSTTTAEATGHVGGIYNKGGDFLWRWGNPEVYRQGTTTDRKLYEQHDAKWVNNGYLEAGKISVFNNDAGGNQTHSSIHLLTPELDTNNNYQSQDNTFLPTDFFWSWEGQVLGETVLELKKSSAQSLPNGNMLFCETSKGRVTEINLNGDILWIYRNPSGYEIYNQFDTDAEISTGNTIFRGEKYPVDYAGFDGLDLSPGGIIEDLNTNSDVCNESLSVNNPQNLEVISLLRNPITDQTIHFTSNLQNAGVIIYDARGKRIFNQSSFNAAQLALPFIESGLYFMMITQNEKQQIIKIIVD